MKVLMIALGSQGDVQPYVALGKGLKRAGHSISFLSFENFEKLVKDNGLEFVPVKGDAQALVSALTGQVLAGGGRNPFRDMAAINQVFGYLNDAIFEALPPQLLAETEATINQLPAALFGYDIAEKYQIPYFSAAVMPLFRTRAFPMPFVPAGPAFMPGYNLFTYKMGEQLVWQSFRRRVNRFRQERLGLPKAPLLGNFDRMLKAKVPLLNGFSNLVIPRPPDWPEQYYLTNYWFLDEPEWSPSPDLVEFIESGPVPVFIGFGSMPVGNPQEFSELLREALRLSGQRGIISAGWGGLGQAEPEDKQIFKVGYVPYSWLFPKMALVVHHGGSGTTEAGLHAGVPSLVVPFGGDQFFWGARVKALGVGPAPIPKKKLTALNLAQAIGEAVSDKVMQQRARELGERLRAEDGIAQALEIFEKYTRR